MKRLTYALIGASALWLNAVPAPALADDAIKPDMGAFGAAITDADLSANRGGQALETLEISANYLDGKLDHNNAYGNMTGANIVTGDSFAGANGIPTVIQNSGNNVLIQNATVVNVKMQ